MPRGRKPTVLVNDIQEQFAEEWFGKEDKRIWPLWIDDIVSGVSRLDWYGTRENQIPLSTTKIIRCFVDLPEITTKSVMDFLAIGERQAKRYVKACVLCYPHFKRALASDIILHTKYPNNTIVSFEHGLALGYDR